MQRLLIDYVEVFRTMRIRVDVLKFADLLEYLWKDPSKFEREVERLTGVELRDYEVETESDILGVVKRIIIKLYDEKIIIEWS